MRKRRERDRVTKRVNERKEGREGDRERKGVKKKRVRVTDKGRRNERDKNVLKHFSNFTPPLYFTSQHTTHAALQYLYVAPPGGRGVAAGGLRGCVRMREPLRSCTLSPYVRYSNRLMGV